MTINHRAEAERHLANAAYHLTEHPGDMRIAEVAAWIGQGHATLAAAEDPIRAALGTLIDRWQEVADAYKPGDLPWDDITRRYRDYRHIYQRNIRDLRHVLDTGLMPCGLMTDEERRRGDCGQIHDDTAA